MERSILMEFISTGFEILVVTVWSITLTTIWMKHNNK